MKRMTGGVLAVTLLAGGCWNHRHPYLSVTADVLMTAAVAELVVVYSGKSKCAAEDANTDGSPCAVAYALLTIPGIVVGLVGVGFGIAVDIDSAREARDKAALAPEPPPPPPESDVRLPPLPDVDTDDTTLSFARQARMAAATGNCGAVRVMLDRIEARDRAYHDALAASPALAACR